MHIYEQYISFGNKETNLVHYSEKKDFSEKEKDMTEFYFLKNQTGKVILRSLIFCFVRIRK